MSERIDRRIMPDIVNEFISDLIVTKNTSKTTVNEYVSDLYLFFRFIVCKREKLSSPADLEKNYDLSYIDAEYISQITLKDVNEFLVYCSSERSNSPVTRARKASAIRGFFKYTADKMNYIDRNPVAKLEISAPKKKLPKYLTLEESISLLESIDGENKIRDYCIITLFLNCGLRLAELVSLNISDINFNENKMVVTGKGNKQRVVYLNKACIDSINSYLQVRPRDRVADADRDALFLSRLNKRIGRQAVQLMVYHYLDKIGLKGQHYSVHKLRHTAATLMYQHGEADLLVIKEVLGHENLSTTEIYTHVENSKVREAVSKNPLSKEKLKSKKV